MIGIILRAQDNIENLSSDWVPEAILSSDVNAAFVNILGYAPYKEEFTYDDGDSLIHFTIDNLSEPRAITFNCTMSGENAAIIKKLTYQLGAKIYNSESGEFEKFEEF